MLKENDDQTKTKIVSCFGSNQKQYQVFDNPENEWFGGWVVDIFISKYAPEWDQYWSVFGDFGVDRQLSFSAVDRHQYHRKPTNNNAIHEYILIPSRAPLILRGNRTPDIMENVGTRDAFSRAR